MATDLEILACFKMPSGLTITGRVSSIRNVFVAAIIPVSRPSAAEVGKVLEILGLSPDNLRCAYCGEKSTEWDHMRPLVRDGKPTGYPSSIKNLVPACGKCNQSKGKSDWKLWMQSKARFSPATRGVADMASRVRRLQEYEAWANCQPLRIETLVDRVTWEQYYKLQEEILTKMREAQVVAVTLAHQIQNHADFER
jgi:hypothetical protein